MNLKNPSMNRRGAWVWLACAALVCTARVARADDVPPGSSVQQGRAASPAATGAPAGGTPGMGTQRIAAIVSAGVGLAALALSATYGLMAMSKRDDARSTCPGSQCTTQAGMNKWNDATAASNVSTVAFIVGCSGVIEAAVLWFGPQPGSVGTRVGVGPSGIRLQGTW
jgi:hypothetical protein